MERDTSNGEQAAGDGHPITINGVVYPKGLGTNSPSDVQVFLGGNCTSFTAFVGVDDEEGAGGTVTFTVSGDGARLASTRTLTNSDDAVPITADVTGVQVIDLTVGDAGDGNGGDHGDWGNAQLVCNSSN